jgi:hypothetical protein
MIAEVDTPNYVACVPFYMQLVKVVNGNITTRHFELIIGNEPHYILSNCKDRRGVQAALQSQRSKKYEVA